MNTIWALIASALSAAAQWMVFSLIIRLAGVAAAGAYAAATAIVIPTFAFASLQLRAHVATRTGLTKEQHSTLLTTRAVTSGIAIAVCAGVGGIWFSKLVPVLLSAALVKVVDANIDLSYGALQASGRMKDVAASQVVRVIAGLAAFGAALGLGVELWVGLAIYAFVLHLEWRRHCSGVPGLAKARVSAKALPAAGEYLRRYSAVGAVALLVSVATSIQRLYVERTASAEQAAQFMGHTLFLSVFMMLGTAIAQSNAPVFAKGRGTRSLELSYRPLGWAVGLSVLTGVMLVTFGPVTMKYVYGADLLEVHTLACVAAAGVVWSANCVLDYVTIAQDRVWSRLCVASVAVAAVVGTLQWGPLSPVDRAAISLIVGGLCFGGGQVIIAWSRPSDRFERGPEHAEARAPQHEGRS